MVDSVLNRRYTPTVRKSTSSNQTERERLRIVEYRPKPTASAVATNNTLANTPIDAPKSEDQIYVLHQNPCSSKQRCNQQRRHVSWVMYGLVALIRGFEFPSSTPTVIVALLIRRYESGVRGGYHLSGWRKDQRSTSKRW